MKPINKTKTILEICAADIDSAYAAARGGADRIELCCALGEGGLTPSAGTIEEALTLPEIKVNVLIRPRAGDFVYSEAELRVMLRNIETCGKLGVNGVVFGALRPDGDIDLSACSRLARAAEGMHMTFHRAFDMCRNPRKAVGDILELGFDRILTSGQEVSAMAGAAFIRELQLEFPEMTFIAAGGVIPSNVSEIIALSGVREIHASAKKSVESSMTFRRMSVSMGKTGIDEYIRQTSDIEKIRQIATKLKTT